MTFFPTGPYTTIFALVLLISVITVLAFGDKSVKYAALALFLSWITARTATWSGYINVQLIGTFICLSVALMYAGTVGKLIAATFALQFIGYGVFIAGFFELETMWFVDEMVAYVQILILVAGGFHGGFRISSFFTRFIPWHNRAVNFAYIWGKSVHPAHHDTKVSAQGKQAKGG